MNKKIPLGIGIGHRACLISLVIGLTVILAVFQAQRNQKIESINGIKIGSSDSIITKEVAGAIALNSFKESENGVTLFHPSHSVNFEKEGVFFQPKKGPEWAWLLTHIGTNEVPLNNLAHQNVVPKNRNSRIVSYKHGNITEEYHAKQKTIEQRFVLAEPLPLDGKDLVIKGQVTSEGQFEELDEGWAWGDSEGQVKLGDVTVFDANGNILMANMNVTAQSTEIIVDAHALATATYPVTIDPEIGANDFLISDMTEASFDPAVAYNSTDDEYLVVWQGKNGDEFEIYGQRLDAFTGAEVGPNDFRISDMGPNGSEAFIASDPAVAYNSTDNQYLVIWRGDDDTLPLVNDEFEIFGQRLSATGNEVGPNDFRISDMGPNGDTTLGTIFFGIGESGTGVAYNSTNNEYLVVWQGEDDIAPLVANEEEIFGQRLNAATGDEVGPNDFRISDMGPNGDAFFKARDPEVAYNPTNNEYLVVWHGSDNTGSLVVDEFEVFGQRLDGATGAEFGANDFRISDMGPDGNFSFNAKDPEVAYNSVNNEYLVVWEGDDDILPLVNNEFEIFGQRLDGATGAEAGPNDFRITDMGPDGSVDSFSYSARDPGIAYNSATNEYLVVWKGRDDMPPLVAGEDEIFGQRLHASIGTELGDNDFRLSDMGPDGTSFSYSASRPTIASSNREFLTVWVGVDGSPIAPSRAFGQFHDRNNKLVSDTSQISIATGGAQNLTLDFGPDLAGSPYLLLGSTIGSSPGVTIDGKNLPLNPDAYFALALMNPNSLTHLPNNSGNLDACGRATVRVIVSPGLNPILSGKTIHHAAVILDPKIIQGVTGTSNATPLHLVN